MSAGLAETVLDATHGRLVHDRRTRILAQRLAPLLPRGARVLDVGTGDGLLATRIAALRPDVQFEGVDVLIRPDVRIPVAPFDGTTLPFPDASWDIVMLIDVVHHASDPVRLLTECGRVARSTVLLKDHLREGFAAQATLRSMDWVGNARHGVRLEYRYFTRTEWEKALRAAGLEVVSWDGRIRLYPGLLHRVFGRGLHFVAELKNAVR